MKKIKNLIYAGLMLGNFKVYSGTQGIKYIPWGVSTLRQTTLAKVRNSQINICLTGTMNSQDLKKYQDWAVRSSLTWLRVFKVLDKEVTGNIVFTCNDIDLRIKMVRGSGRSFANPSRTTIYMNRGFGTWTHELGHAFVGLGDTYRGSQAGSCQRGHPQSLMCWGAYGPRRDYNRYSTLWSDDIKGAQYNYKKLYGNLSLEPPAWADEIDLEDTFDPSQPWPEEEIYVEYFDSEVKIREMLPSVEQSFFEGLDI